ncbi:MAG: hypothetical protein K6T65_11880 [Peptococcaceae bacterium]|nr:hypothetical protein [Peptococcaceae bacterium]
MRFFKDQRGSSFLENALWIILFVLAIAPFVLNLATATGSKFESMAERIGEVGTP